MSVCFHRLAAPGQLVLFAMGGTAYLALEIAWRGTTHWTMFLAGGACLCALDALGRLPLPTPLLAGIGADMEHLYTLADRNWQELPPPEREELRSVVRDAKRHLGGLAALAARV